jgi:hypothetical protein
MNPPDRVLEIGGKTRISWATHFDKMAERIHSGVFRV